MKAGLKGIDIRLSYNSDFVDISNLFFNPALKEAVLYERITGYFSSSSLKVISEGLSSLMWSGGEARILMGVVVSKEDFDSIKMAKIKAQKPLKDLFGTVDELKSMMQYKNVEAFAKLLQSGLLKIKFAITDEGIFHIKYGILVDKDGNSISFAGSLNETTNGLSKNVEEFNVFKSWIQGEDKYARHYATEFQSYWNGNTYGRAIIVDMPEEIKNIVSRAYKEYSAGSKYKAHPVELWENQKNAISAWEKNGMCGIVEMATGTGKTVMALNALMAARKLCSPLLVIISVPTRSLMDQWQHELLAKMQMKSIILKTSDSILELQAELRLASENSAVIGIGTYQFLRREPFQNFISNRLGGKNMLIADEAHNAGAPAFSSIMKPNFKIRLGISATPVRYMDEEGTNSIIEYFRGIVFSYTIKDAIEDGRISKYKYFPVFCRLSDAEMDEYNELTKKYGKMAFLNAKDDCGSKNLGTLLLQRARILKKAQGKISKFSEIVAELKNSGKEFHAIVFYEDKEQMKSGGHVLESLLLKNYTFDSRNNKKERDTAIKFFKEGEQSFLCTIRAADEGIDIPVADTAIIFSETGNPRQAWQRLGRVLRNYSGKELASVYEISAMPGNTANDVSWKVEQNIAIKEIKRMCILCANAENIQECSKKLELYGDIYKVGIWKYLNEVMH